MIRYVLGGVALAATGYGLKRYIEDEIAINSLYKGYDKNSTKDDEDEKPIHVDLYSDEFEVLPELKEVIEKYKDAKRELRQNSLKELKSALSEINDIDTATQRIIANFDYIERYDFKSYSDELIKEFEHYAKILQDTKNYIDKYFDKLDTIIIATQDYQNYSDEDKKLVDTFLSICTILDKIDNRNITDDKETIVREVKRAYAKINTIIY